MRALFVILIALFVVFFISYYAYTEELLGFWQEIYSFISLNVPWLEPALVYAQEQMMAGTKEGLAIYCFFGQSPLLPMPVEPYLLYASSQGLSLVEILIYGSGFSALGACVSYVGDKPTEVFITEGLKCLIDSVAIYFTKVGISTFKGPFHNHADDNPFPV